MKGVILAGGTGSRLDPLTRVTNKHLLPIGSKPMIYYPIEKLTQAGITEILIVTGTEHMGTIVQLLGSGKDFKCQFTYKVQDEPGGIAQALSLGKTFSEKQPIVVILGDNIFQDNIQTYIKNYNGYGAHIFLKKVKYPERFGVVEIKDNTIKNIIEKPKNPPSQYAVTGIYIYDYQVFEYISQLKPSARGEYEITDVNKMYLHNNTIGYDTLKGWWTDAGTMDSYRLASKYVNNMP